MATHLPNLRLFYNKPRLCQVGHGNYVAGPASAQRGNSRIASSFPDQPESRIGHVRPDKDTGSPVASAISLMRIREENRRSARGRDAAVGGGFAAVQDTAMFSAGSICEQGSDCSNQREGLARGVVAEDEVTGRSGFGNMLDG